MIYLLIAVIAAVIALMFVQYNGLVALRQMTQNAWSDVDVYLKRRAELIPNLVAAVKAYASHEQAVLSAVVEARSNAAVLKGAGTDRASAEGAVASSLLNVLAIAENYPELKASDNFLNLQRELSDTEKYVASSRQYYNACVRDYNTKIEAFPSNIVAGPFGFRHMEFFEPDSALERVAPKIGS